VNALTIYNGSDGGATKALYERLQSIGPVGVVALNIFRAQKASGRAKEYSRRFKGVAYDKKQWSMANLCDVLEKHGAELNILFGWKQDPEQPYYPWVLYVTLPTGQCSFHSPVRGKGPDYSGDWDGSTGSAARIIRWVQAVLDEHFPQPADCDSESVSLCKGATDGQSGLASSQAPAAEQQKEGELWP
jgi:hypothetical protein